MLDLFKGVKQTALETGEKAIRLFFEIVAVASERMRSRSDHVDQSYPSYPPYTPPAEPTTPPVVTAEPVRPTAAVPPSSAKAAAKPSRRRAPAKRRGKKRPDQLVRVLSLLAESGGWMSAKELSDTGGASGTPILPGNVRKVIRARGDVVIETRPREGSRRGALEYRITAAGTQRIASPS
jgi:hypothetical protein